MAEKDHPITNLIRNTVHDPATNKIFTAVFSGILIVSAANNVRYAGNLGPVLLIFAASFVYSMIAVLLVILKKQESIGDCPVLKKIFGGRKIYWHEIQSTASLSLAFANFSAFAVLGNVYRAEYFVLFTLLNVLFFGFEWYFAVEHGKVVVLDDETPESTNPPSCWRKIFKIFQGILPNILRKACFIASVVLIATSSMFGDRMIYFFYCTVFSIVASLALFVLQISNKYFSTLVLWRKWHTYLTLLITIHALLAVLSLSLIVEGRYVKVTDDSENAKLPKGSKNNGSATVMATTHNSGSRHYHQHEKYHSFNAPEEAPVAFMLSCLALTLSVLDLWSRIICPKSCTEFENDASCDPPQITTEFTKPDDLPIVLAAPYLFDKPYKQFP
jgi:hypothetical protein